MATTRSLIDGLKATPEPVDPVKARQIVYGARPEPASTPKPGRKQRKEAINTRVRADFAAAVKRASLERQLKDIYPYTVQDILEEALEPWLKANGYLP